MGPLKKYLRAAALQSHKTSLLSPYFCRYSRRHPFTFCLFFHFLMMSSLRGTILGTLIAAITQKNILSTQFVSIIFRVSLIYFCKLCNLNLETSR